jgi:hypothetical protein
MSHIPAIDVAFDHSQASRLIPTFFFITKHSDTMFKEPSRAESEANIPILDTLA